MSDNKVELEEDEVSFVNVVDFLFQNRSWIKCCGCERTLDSVSWYVDKYVHKFGVKLREFGKERFWIFVHCCNCGYDTSLQKIIRQVTSAKREQNV